MATFLQEPRRFKLARHMNEANKEYLQLSKSDVEPLLMRDLLKMADDECKALWENMVLQYVDNSGNPLLRTEVAKLLGGKLRVEDILVVAPQEGCLLGLKAAAAQAWSRSEGKRPHAVVTSPSYQGLSEGLRMFGCDFTEWKIRYDAQYGWSFCTQDLCDALQDDTQLLIINFPHNPTGFLPPEEDWLKMFEIARERGLYVVSDEIYWFTNRDGDEAMPSACRLYEKAISVGGVVKTYGAPGTRIGWACSRDPQLITSMLEFKDYLTVCPSGPMEILATIAVRNAKALFQRATTTIQLNLKTLQEFFAKYPGLFEWHPCTAGTTGFLKLKGRALEQGEGGASGFCKELASRVGVWAVPAAVYHYEDDCIRVGFGREDLDAVVVLLGRFVEDVLQGN